MNAPIERIRASMDRRILVNFRVRPDVLARGLPPPFRPRSVAGWGMAGLCLIWLESLRPAWAPAFLGFASRNAAHRVAVEWEDAGRWRAGVYVVRRDTDSRVSRWAGGRLFPGAQRAASFRTTEEGGRFRCAMHGEDGGVEVRVDVEACEQWPGGSVWGSLAEASAFFRAGCRGWSTAHDGRTLEGAELETGTWEMIPLRVHEAFSSYFGDERRFPKGTVEFDSALLMRGIPHAWKNLGVLQSEAGSLEVGRPHVHGTHGPSALFRLP